MIASSSSGSTTLHGTATEDQAAEHAAVITITDQQAAADGVHIAQAVDASTMSRSCNDA